MTEGFERYPFPGRRSARSSPQMHARCSRCCSRSVSRQGPTNTRAQWGWSLAFSYCLCYRREACSSRGYLLGAVYETAA